MNKIKRTVFMREANLVHLGQGTYKLLGYAVNHYSPRCPDGQRTLTSTIIRKDFSKNEFESQNTLYRIFSWSKAQREEWQRITARALQGPIAEYRIPKRVRGAGSGESDQSRH